jgi:hypothetical protein
VPSLQSKVCGWLFLSCIVESKLALTTDEEGRCILKHKAVSLKPEGQQERDTQEKRLKRMKMKRDLMTERSREAYWTIQLLS